MPTQGLLTEVLVTERGSNAAEAALVGATEILVDDVTDFTDYSADDTADPETQALDGVGIVVDILGERYTVATVTENRDDSTTEGAGGDYDLTDLAPGVVSLTEPLRVQVDEGDPVWLVIGDAVASDAYALVSTPQTANVLGDETDSGDVAQVPIPYGFRASYPEGVYDPPVPIVVADDLSVVLDTPGVRPVIDGSTIINLPDVQPPTEPPASSPAIVAHGTADALVVEVTEEYASTTTLDFHISTEPDFAPSPETLAGSSRSAVYVITTLGSSSDRLVPGTIYYVRTVARNEIGSAPAGPIVPGVLDPSVVSEIVAAKLVAGFVLAGSIQVGNITINPETGITIPQSDGGTIHFPSDGSPAMITAYLNARGLRVENDLTINGVGELAGTLTMTGGAPPPKTPPALTSGYPMISVGPYTVGDYERPATDDGFDTWTWGEEPRVGVMVQAFTNGGQGFMIHDATTGDLLRWITMNDLAGSPFGTDFSIWVYSVSLAGHGSGSSTYPPNIPDTPGSTTRQHPAWILARIRDFTVVPDSERYYLILVDLASATDTAPPTYIRHVEVTGLLANARATSSGHPRVAIYRDGSSSSAYNDFHPVLLWDQTDNSVRAAVFDGVAPTVPQIGTTQTLIAASSTVRYLNGAAFTGFGQLQLVLPAGAAAKMTQFSVTAAHGTDGRLSGLTYARTSEIVDVPFPEGAASGSTAWCQGIAVREGIEDYVFVLYPEAGRIYRLRADSNQGTMNERATGYKFAAAYTWYDGNPTGGIHESTPSPATTITLPPMTWPIITAPAPPHSGITDPLRPDLANRVGIYAASGAGTVGPVKLQTYLPVGQRAVPAGGLHPGRLDATTDPPTVDGFAQTTETPGTIQSGTADATGPLIKMDETGAARFGNLRVASGVANIGRMQTWYTQGSNPVGNASFAIHTGGWADTYGDHPINDGWTGVIYSGTGIFTCQEPGRYEVEFGYNWDANTGGRRILTVHKNDSAPSVGTGYRRSIAQVPAISGVFFQSVLARLYLAVGDTVRVGMYQSGSTGSVTLGASTSGGPHVDGVSYSQYIEILRLG